MHIGVCLHPVGEQEDNSHTWASYVYEGHSPAKEAELVSCVSACTAQPPQRGLFRACTELTSRCVGHFYLWLCHGRASSQLGFARVLTYKLLARFVRSFQCWRTHAATPPPVSRRAIESTHLLLASCSGSGAATAVGCPC